MLLQSPTQASNDLQVLQFVKQPEDNGTISPQALPGAYPGTQEVQQEPAQRSDTDTSDTQGTPEGPQQAGRQ